MPKTNIPIEDISEVETPPVETEGETPRRIPQANVKPIMDRIDLINSRLVEVETFCRMLSKLAARLETKYKTKIVPVGTWMGVKFED